MSRIQIATDVAHGLDYIHNTAGFSINLVHKHVKSSSIIITEPSFKAKLCHFGAAELCGETQRKNSEIMKNDNSPDLSRTETRGRQFEGVRGYMSPEFQSTGLATQQSDVFAFGTVVLELLTGEEPVKYNYDKASGEFRKISVIETARAALEGTGSGEKEGTEGRLRKWMDRRLNDSFPVDLAEKLTRIALQCVDVDPHNRPDMRRVAGKISKLYLESKRWSEAVRLPTDFSVSLAPR